MIDATLIEIASQYDAIQAELTTLTTMLQDTP